MGATSGIGRCALDEAVSRDLPVRAFARSADRLEQTDLVEPCVGDATSIEDVTRALSGVRAVIYALGITERLSMLWEEETLFSETTRVLLQAMAQTDVSRLVVVTGFGAGDSKSAMSWIERSGHRAILGKPYADKDRQEALIMASDVEWTIVRPVILTKRPRSETYQVLRDPKSWRNGLISRASVAHYLVNAVEHGHDLRSGVVLSR